MEYFNNYHLALIAYSVAVDKEKIKTFEKYLNKIGLINVEDKQENDIKRNLYDAEGIRNSLKKGGLS